MFDKSKHELILTMDVGYRLPSENIKLQNSKVSVHSLITVYNQLHKHIETKISWNDLQN